MKQEKTNIKNTKLFFVTITISAILNIPYAYVVLNATNNTFWLLWVFQVVLTFIIMNNSEAF
jgi:hypothetical protein